jgi:hypothetical protein
MRARLMLLLIVLILAACQQPDPREEYYRGVYDFCIHQAVIELGTSTWDAHVLCRAIVEDARAHRWYESPSGSGWGQP